MFLPQEILVSLFRCFVQPSSRVVNHGDSEHIFAGEVKMMEYDEQVYSLPIAPCFLSESEILDLLAITVIFGVNFKTDSLRN